MKEERKKILRAALWMLFVLYSIMAVYILLLQRLRMPELSFADYFRYRCNFVPFATIWDYIDSVRSGGLPVSHAMFNIGGNFIVLLPLGYFLPSLFEKMRWLKKTALTAGAVTLSVELIQMLLRTGSFDVDDLILNAAGAVAGYLIWRILPFFKK